MPHKATALENNYKLGVLYVTQFYLWFYM